MQVFSRLFPGCSVLFLTLKSHYIFYSLLSAIILTEQPLIANEIMVTPMLVGSRWSQQNLEIFYFGKKISNIKSTSHDISGFSQGSGGLFNCEFSAGSISFFTYNISDHGFEISNDGNELNDYAWKWPVSSNRMKQNAIFGNWSHYIDISESWALYTGVESELSNTRFDLRNLRSRPVSLPGEIEMEFYSPEYKIKSRELALQGMLGAEIPIESLPLLNITLFGGYRQVNNKGKLKALTSSRNHSRLHIPDSCIPLDCLPMTSENINLPVVPLIFTSESSSIGAIAGILLGITITLETNFDLSYQYYESSKASRIRGTFTWRHTDNFAVQILGDYSNENRQRRVYSIGPSFIYSY